MRVLVKCFLCKSQLTESDAAALYLHPVGSCSVRVTDRFGVSLDDVYEVEGEVIYERPVSSVVSATLEDLDSASAPSPADWTLDLGLDLGIVEQTPTVAALPLPAPLPEPARPLGVKERLRLPMAPPTPTKPAAKPQTKNDTDFEITLVDPRNHDEAISELFAEAGTPKLGGASGEAGWSSFSTFQRCPYLWYRNYFVGDRNHDPAKPLIIGSLLHLFLAFHYQKKIDPAYPLTSVGAHRALGEKGVHPDALAEAWRLYTGYQTLYEEEPYLTPLAVEYLAADTKSKESCRYDMIARIDGEAPLAVCVETTENPHNVVYKSLTSGTYIYEHKCLPADAKVWDYNTNRQWTVGELYRFGVAPKLLAFDQSSGKLVRTQAEEIRPEQVRDVFEVTTLQGRHLRTSNNHPFLTAEGWKAAEALTPDDWLAVPATTSVGDFESPHTDAVIRLIGYLLSEGSLTGSIVITQNLGAVFSDLEQMVKDLDLSEEDFKIHNEPHRAAYIQFSTAKDTYVRELTQVHNMYGKRSHEHCVPAAFMSLPDRQTGILLGALWDGDGACEVQKRGKDRGEDRLLPCIRYTTSSRKLAEDVQSLLLRLGVTSSITGQNQTLPDGRLYISYKTTVVSRVAKRLFCEQLLSGRIRSVRVVNEAEAMLHVLKDGDDSPVPVPLVKARLQGVTGKLHAKLANRIAYSCDAFEKRTLKPFGLMFDDEIGWERVSSVRIVGKERMYDISVPGMNTFVANDLITHNTSGRRDENSLTGWANDGEILGQQMLWKRLNLDEKFGPLQGTIVNLLGKQKNPSFDRILIPVKPEQTRQHAKDLKVWAAFRQLCIAQDSFPRARANCVGRWGKCTQWDHCRGGKGGAGGEIE